MVLVTGGSGLVGSELINQLLTQGEQVKAIYNKTPLADFKDENLIKIKCDILDSIELDEALEGVTHVYHCAAVVSFNPKDKNQLYRINIEGTANVVNACIDAGIKKLVHVSSVAALGRIKDGQTTNEDMHWTEEANDSIYGKSKYMGEMEVWRGTGEGLDAVIVNPSLILGPGDWTKGSSGIFKAAYNEFPWYTDGVTGFVDVKDVARAMILLMNSEIINQRFILNGDNISFKNIFTWIAECFNKKPPHKKVTHFLAGIVWRLEGIKSKLSGKAALLTRETSQSAQSKIYFDNSKILNALPGFSFTPINKTIKNTCATLQLIHQL